MLRIFGPPGTGKTTTLLNMVDEALENGTHPHRIAFLAFTRKAANEAKERAAERFGLDPKKDLIYFRTLHSLALIMSDIRPEQVMQSSNYKELSDAIGVTLGGAKNTSFDEDVPSMVAANDPILGLINLTRLKKSNLREEYNHSNLEADWNTVNFVAKSLQEYKKGLNLYDFTDMLEQFVTHSDRFCPQFDLCFLDEAQDLSALQWDIAHILDKNSKRMYCAGDDDQAIYEWNGADVNLFQTFPGKSLVLKKSVRLNKNIHFFSKCLLNSMGENRIQKEFYSNGKEGQVYRWNGLKKVPWDMDGSWMVLARINDVKKELQQEARNLGLYYQDQKNNKSFDPNQFAAINYWEKVCDGGSITREEATTMYEFLLNIDHGYRSTDSKKWSFAHPNQVFTFDELHLRCGMRDEKGPWNQVFKRKFKEKDKQYFQKLMNEGVDLSQPPKIIIDTIHQVKGGEADNVVLASKCNFPSHFDKKNLADKVKELRVWYTGATRSKSTLHLLGTYHQYNFPLGKYYKQYEANYVR